MKYERLTPRMLLSDAIKEYYQPKKMWRTFKYGKHDMLDLIDRLVELENKIERGELVEVPQGAVVLTPEERAEEVRLANEERKEAMKEFAERVKMAFYYEFDELIPSIMADKIDALVKEECGKEKRK